MDVLQLAQHLGTPDIKLAGLSIWVHARTYPDATDYWDGNWIRATAVCQAPGAKVSVSGTILHLSGLAIFREGASRLHRELEGEANWDNIEPHLSVKLLASSRQGKVDLHVDVTPDNVAQQHHFTFEIDQSYLPQLVADCDAVLSRFPVRSSNR